MIRVKDYICKECNMENIHVIFIQFDERNILFWSEKWVKFDPRTAGLIMHFPYLTIRLNTTTLASEM